MASILFIAYIAIGIILLVAVALKPRLFWPALIVAAVFAAGLSIRGYTIFDEYFIGCVLAGGLLSISVGATHLYRRKEDIWEYLHRWIFYLFVIYMVVESVRGMLILESVEKSRWVVFYGMLGIIAFVVSKKGFPVPNARKVSLIVSASATIYLIVYLLHGFLFTEVFRGISRFAIQPGEWSTTAYALFPLVVAIPAAIYLIQDKNHQYRWIGWATLILAILAAFYYLSRVSWLVIFGFLFISLFKLGIRRVVLLIICFLLIFSLLFGITGKAALTERGRAFFGELWGTVEAIQISKPAHDIERQAHWQVGFVSISENWGTFLFGYGFRTHGWVISPQLKKLFEEKGRPDLAAKVRDDQSTEGFTALLVDTGLVGILLLGMNFLLTARKVFIQKKNPNRTLLLLCILFAFLWLPVINMLDIMLFYLLIMPQGLLYQLSEYKYDRHIY